MALSLKWIPVLIGGIVLIDENKIVLGILQVVASILNILMFVKVRNEKRMERLNYAVLAMNVIVCISIGIDYMLANKSYIQYAWFFAAIVSLVALVLQVRKNTSPDNDTIK